MTEERYWDDAKVGDECMSPTMTVTETQINTYADLTGDHTPLHVDEEYAKKTPFGKRVAHGLLGLSLADGLKTQSEYRFLPGMSLGWTWDFAGPIKIGDTVHVKFRSPACGRRRASPAGASSCCPPSSSTSTARSSSAASTG